MAEEHDDEGQDAIDDRTLRVLARKTIPRRVELLEKDAIECAHDRDRLSGALDRSSRAQERVATALERRGERRPWTAKEWALVIGASAGALGMIGTEVARLVGK